MNTQPIADYLAVTGPLEIRSWTQSRVHPEDPGIIEVFDAEIYLGETHISTIRSAVIEVPEVLKEMQRREDKNTFLRACVQEALK